MKYFENRAKQMRGKILAKRRGVLEKGKGIFRKGEGRN